MTEADRLFSKFPDFIKEYIYSHGWTSIREIQLEAARVIFETDDNLLLSSSTASGKTEAAFFPILSDLYEHPSEKRTVEVLYVAPLKSLINDQFYRLEEVLQASNVALTHWHGDVGASHKNKLLENPSGILQITPESLEAMLIHRPNDIPRLFGGLRFVVLDEIHAMIGSDRGSQVLCQLQRIGHLIGRHPRRIGLSATLGDTGIAADWLGAGSGRNTAAPVPLKTPLRWRLLMNHFFIQNPMSAKAASVAREDGMTDVNTDPGFAFLYNAVSDKKALVFSNSREETEYVTATLRQIAKNRGEEDVFLIHHGNLSAALREEAESKMKDESETRAVTCATVTMELGIDIGKLERVAQMGAPTTVSGFLQRLGRSGRRGNPPEMIMVYREETPLPNTPLPYLIPWELLRGIAIVDLYASERFIEPPRIKKMPLSLAFHQTLSILASSGELTAKTLAEKVLSLPPFYGFPRETYRALLVDMVNSDYLEMTENKGMIVGLAGERILNSYKFFAVFKDSEDYTVRNKTEEIGTITTPPPVGDRFALAGRVWEVTDTDLPHKLIFVKAVEGKMEVSWPGGSGEIHTRLLETMRDVLFNGKEYAFLSESAKKRLDDARKIAAIAKMNEKLFIPLGGNSFVLFPWLGTRSFRTMKRFLMRYAGELGLSDVQSEGCCFITFKSKCRDADELARAVGSVLRRDGVDVSKLVFSGECPVFDKYDDFIDPELLREAFCADRLLGDEIIKRFGEDV